MAITSSSIEQQITELTRAIGKGINGDNGEPLPNRGNHVLKVFKLDQKNVIFTWDEDGLQVVVEQKNQRSIMPLENIEGLPKECLANRKKMADYLAKCNLSIPQFPDQNLNKMRLNLSALKGGGNIGVGINYWPLEKVEGRYRFVIPYTLFASEDAASILNRENTVRVGLLRQAIKAGTLEGKALKGELTTIETIQKAIEMWNQTGLVILENIGSTAAKSDRWITFKNNRLEICKAPCIGMCDQSGEQPISCDLEGKFHSNLLHHMLHEIGHVIGLRHEHVRLDSTEYVRTNIVESQAEASAVGVYDFLSVMHYGIGNYDGGEYLRFSDKFRNFMLQNFPAEGTKLLQDKEAEVGKSGSISAGDKQSVQELIRLAVAKAAKEAAEKAAKAAAEKAAKDAKDKKTATEGVQPNMSPSSLLPGFQQFNLLSLQPMHPSAAATHPSAYYSPYHPSSASGLPPSFPPHAPNNKKYGAGRGGWNTNG